VRGMRSVASFNLALIPAEILLYPCLCTFPSPSPISYLGRRLLRPFNAEDPAQRRTAGGVDRGWDKDTYHEVRNREGRE